MQLIKKSTLMSFAAKHVDAADWLKGWVQTVRAAEWKKFSDVRAIYPRADTAVVNSGNTVVIFDVKGNRYRLVVAIHFNAQKIYVRDFMTHAEYDDQKWKQQH